MAETCETHKIVEYENFMWIYSILSAFFKFYVLVFEEVLEYLLFQAAEIYKFFFGLAKIFVSQFI